MKGERFLSPSEIKRMAETWRAATKRREPAGRFSGVPDEDAVFESYNATRGVEAVDALHGLKFIDEVIPALISRKKPGEKVRVLDVGGGLGVFTNQIRQKFGDRVLVFSTGLSKKSVRHARHAQKINDPLTYERVVANWPERLDSNDLKWRSIKELSDFEEFDLIVDTYGEFAYTLKGISQNDFITEQNIDAVFTHIKLLVSKLKPGGIISICPIDFWEKSVREKLINFMNDVKVKFNLEYIISPKNKDNGAVRESLRITKNT